MSHESVTNTNVTAPERITFDGDRDRLDEVVLNGATVHVEALDTHTYMIIAVTPDGRTVHLEAEDVRVFELDNADDLVRIDPPLPGCGFEWGNWPRAHHCHQDGPHQWHQCDCGTFVPRRSTTPQ